MKMTKNVREKWGKKDGLDGKDGKDKIKKRWVTYKWNVIF